MRDTSGRRGVSVLKDGGTLTFLFVARINDVNPGMHHAILLLSMRRG